MTAGCPARDRRATPSRLGTPPEAIDRLRSDGDSVHDPEWLKTGEPGRRDLLAAFASPSGHRVLVVDTAAAPAELVVRSFGPGGDPRGSASVATVTDVAVDTSPAGAVVAWAEERTSRSAGVVRFDRTGAADWQAELGDTVADSVQPVPAAVLTRRGGGAVGSFASGGRDSQSLVAYDGTGQQLWRLDHDVPVSTLVESGDARYATGEAYRPDQCPNACIATPPVVAKLSPGGVEWRYEDLYPGTAAGIGSDGVALVSSRELDPSELPASASESFHPALTVQRLGPDGTSRWYETYPQPQYGHLAASHRRADGSLLLFGSLDLWPVATDGDTRTVVTCIAPDGTRQWAGRVGPPDAGTGVSFVTPTDEGTYLLGGGFVDWDDDDTIENGAWAAELYPGGTVWWLTATADVDRFVAGDVTDDAYLLVGPASGRDPASPTVSVQYRRPEPMRRG
jgi:hypothetical protein